MTDILLPRPTLGQIPDYIPVSNQALSYDLKNLLWLQNAKAGEGLVNTGGALQATGMLEKNSVSDKLIKEIRGRFYVLSGMETTKTADMAFSVSAGTAVIDGVEHSFQKRDLVMSVSTSPDGIYTINVNDVLGIYSNAWHYFADNILSYVIIKGGVITNIVEAPVRGVPIFNVLNVLNNSLGVVTKNIAIMPTGVDTIKRTQGVFIDGMSHEKSLPELSPAEVEIVNSEGIRIGSVSSHLDLAELHKIENPTTHVDTVVRTTEYALIPYFVRKTGVITFLKGQNVLTDVSHIEDVHIKHILDQYIMPKKLTEDAGMIGVLILKGNERSLISTGAYYYPLTLNENTVLRSVGYQLPTLTNSDTGLLYYEEPTHSFDLKSLFGITPQDGDFFVKENNALVNARDVFENLKYPGHLPRISNTEVSGFTTNKIEFVDFSVNLGNTSTIGVIGGYLIITDDSISVGIEYSKSANTSFSTSAPMAFFLTVDMLALAQSIYNLPSMEISFWLLKPDVATVKYISTSNSYEEFWTVEGTIYVNAENPSAIPVLTPPNPNLHPHFIYHYDKIIAPKLCIIQY